VLPETFGRAPWLGPPLFAAVPETGHNWRRSCKLKNANFKFSFYNFQCELLGRLFDRFGLK
jgi:hypothetical protein